MKQKHIRLFFIIALAVSTALIVIIAPRASSFPDGLEWAAAKIGFDKRATESAVSRSAPMKDYSAGGVKNEALSTSIAGVAGMAAVFLTAWGGALALKRRNNGNTAEKTSQ